MNSTPDLPPLRSFIGTLSAAAAANWGICKETGLWGSGAATGARHAARRVKPGDLMFVWQGGAGLLALARITSKAEPVDDIAKVPWPQPERYRDLFTIEVVAELDVPVPDQFVDHRSLRFGLQTHQVQKGFIGLRPEQAYALADAIGLDLGTSFVDSDSDDRSTSLPPTKDVLAPQPFPAVAVVDAQKSESVLEAMLELWRIDTGSGGGSGLLVVIGPAEQSSLFELQMAQTPFEELSDRFRFVAHPRSDEAVAFVVLR